MQSRVVAGWVKWLWFLSGNTRCLFLFLPFKRGPIWGLSSLGCAAQIARSSLKIAVQTTAVIEKLRAVQTTAAIEKLRAEIKGDYLAFWSQEQRFSWVNAKQSWKAKELWCLHNTVQFSWQDSLIRAGTKPHSPLPYGYVSTTTASQFGFKSTSKPKLSPCRSATVQKTWARTSFEVCQVFTLRRLCCAALRFGCPGSCISRGCMWQRSQRAFWEQCSI